MSQSTEKDMSRMYEELEVRLRVMIESGGLTRDQALAELGFCPKDLESLPCLTCGAGT